MEAIADCNNNQLLYHAMRNLYSGSRPELIQARRQFGAQLEPHQQVVLTE
jgi:hypothetical protein